MLMLSLKRLVPATVLGLAFTATAAHAQFYKLHNADVGVSAAGQYTTSITDQTTAPEIQTPSHQVPHQTTTDSPGVIFTIRDHPFAWAGIEFNYQYTKLSERYVFYPKNQGQQYANLPTSFHEATGAYLFHPHFRKLQPYIGVGGGYIDFVPTTRQSNQWRGTGLFEVGLDIPTSNPHFGFRVGARSLLYRAPNYGNSLLSSSRWVATNEPQAGTWIRF